MDGLDDTQSVLNPFLNLPIDILLHITKNLAFRDLIALSLTTKGLRYIRPKRPEDKREVRCMTRIHRRFLAADNRPQGQHKPIENGSWNPFVDRCPYCQDPLCPPTCETALFLDADSGFFFPRHLFPINLAKFKYGRRSTEQHKEYAQFPSQKRTGQTYFYSTIWCEHHRCPRDMLAKDKYYNFKNGLGVPLFLKEYHQWRQTKLLCHEVGIGYWVHDRWKVGHRLPPGAQGLDEAKEDDLVPVHEKFFYDSICLHCLSELPFEMDFHFWRQAQFLAYFCTCNRDAKRSKEGYQPPKPRRRTCCYRGPRVPIEHEGCQTCGYLSMKFTRIEAFDFVQERADGTRIEKGRGEGYWAYLATECRMGPAPAGYRGDEKRRLWPARPEENAKFLDIVRGPGYGLISLDKPGIGIQDLPNKVLRQILGYLAAGDPKDLDGDMHFFALRSSYCFIKAWYGREAIGQVKQNLTEPYYILSELLTGMSPRNFDETDKYTLGQIDHKARILKPDTHRRYYKKHVTASVVDEESDSYDGALPVPLPD
ncbi:hypothetical protein TWF730_007577 [Orbilia blumenaviensis]|uniref:F-box domain-containing protein n=1 Tax=Orbilia blumenaviensis TaxID=1796055 RepID=A0AAV9V8D9_9PEZI